MQLLHRLLFKLKHLFARNRKDSELTEELRTHLEMQIEANLAAGMTPAKARREAFLQIGGVDQAREACRDEYSYAWLESLTRDLRHGLRGLLKRPGFTCIAVATLALGIGASTAVFSIVETVLLRPLPFPAAHELMDIRFELAAKGNANIGCSVPELDDLRALKSVFSEVSMVFPMDGNLTGVPTPQRVEALAVSPSYFRVLGVAPALGRTFGDEEASIPGWAPGCVLSHEAWMNYFGGDPAVLGKKFYMDYDPYVVVGVMPAGFRHPGRILSSNVDVWFTGGLRVAPFTPTPERNYRIIPGVIGRLAPGVSPSEARGLLERHAVETRTQYPKSYETTERWTPQCQSLQAMLGSDLQGVLWLLLGAVLLVLMICCATVANLMLVRATTRRQELALRCALGASRHAIIRQLLVEGLLIAGAGCLLGLLIAWLLSPTLMSLSPISIPVPNQVALNGSVLLFAVTVSGLTCLVFGLAPALQASRLDLVTDLKSGGRSSGTGAETQRWRSLLVIAQVALSMLLLVNAGLLSASFMKVWRTSPGFAAHNVLVGRIWLPPPSSADSNRVYLEHTNRAKLIRELVRRFSDLPGVQAAAIANDLPLVQGAQGDRITVDAPAGGALVDGTASTSQVTPDYFRTLGIPLLQGRPFRDTDNGGNAVAIVNQALASRCWPGQNPVGRRLAKGDGKNPSWCTIVGVVADTRAEGLDQAPAPRVYFPEYQDSWLALTFFVRSQGPLTETLTQAVTREIHQADGDLPVYGLNSMDQILNRSLARPRFLAAMLGVFAGMSVLLAALGIYGLISLTVTHRTKEIGVRIALGASRAQITAMILRQGLTLSLVGMGAGSVGALVATRVIQGWLYKTQPLDPLIWVSITLLLLLITTLACWLPARKAAATDSLVAMRAE